MHYSNTDINIPRGHTPSIWLVDAHPPSHPLLAGKEILRQWLIPGRGIWHRMGEVGCDLNKLPSWWRIAGQGPTPFSFKNTWIKGDTLKRVYVVWRHIIRLAYLWYSCIFIFLVMFLYQIPAYNHLRKTSVTISFFQMSTKIATMLSTINSWISG